MKSKADPERDTNTVENTMVPVIGHNVRTPTEVATEQKPYVGASLLRALSVALIDLEQNSHNPILITSYERDTRPGLMRLERHELDVRDNGNEYVNLELNIVAFSLGRTEMCNDKGELSAVPILTLETKDGKLLNLFSPSVLRCFISRLRVHLFDGALSDIHPIKLKLVRRQTSNERSMYWLERP